MKVAEKDEQYALFVYNTCRDVIRHLLGMRVVVAYRNKTKLLRQGFYYVLTIGSGQQTLGEEYCDITQVAGVLDRSLSSGLCHGSRTWILDNCGRIDISSPKF
ncbi:hypothetical protein ACFX1X_023082 [Malus domestica]